jgi:hypothetical protein
LRKGLCCGYYEERIKIVLVFDYDDKGTKYQIYSPIGKYINLIIVSIPDDKTIELETRIDYSLVVENFNK